MEFWRRAISSEQTNVNAVQARTRREVPGQFDSAARTARSDYEAVPTAIVLVTPSAAREAETDRQ